MSPHLHAAETFGNLDTKIYCDARPAHSKEIRKAHRNIFFQKTAKTPQLYLDNPPVTPPPPPSRISTTQLSTTRLSPKRKYSTGISFIFM